MSDPTTPYLKFPRQPTSPDPAAVPLPLLGAPADQAPTYRDGSPPTPTPEPFVPRRFAEYELIAEVARGGMGVVYRAIQHGLNRTVALKMILAGRLATPDDVARFRTEAEAAARLMHPHIVSVFEVGESEGNHYFSMEYIEGMSLSQVLEKGPIPNKSAARWLKTIAEAVHHAHKQGIVHRDLKPSNVLIDGDDRPHITDFGLAKRIHEDQGQTRTGAVLGTPSYMSPEQAQGRVHEIGPATDVYSLGAILYECLTGRPPFRSDNAYDTVRQVIHDEPPAPRSIRPEIDEDLALICMKCLEKEPDLRYASAAELAEDLGRTIAGEPIVARSLNVIDRITRMLDRSQHDYAFHTWSSMLKVMAGVILVEHLLVYVFMWTDMPRPAIFAVRFLQFVIFALLFLYHRGNRLLPSTSAERELWSIWIGYLFTYAIGIFATRAIGRQELLIAGPEATEFERRYMAELLPYPFVALASGLAFFVMGSNYWGRCYAFGVAFWALAAIMPFTLEWAPVMFGTTWSIMLAWLGLHLDRLGKIAQAEQAARTVVQASAPTAPRSAP